MTIFYLFVITAFVANAIVRDDSSGFAPVVRATRVTGHQLVLGRFLGGVTVAWLGYLAVPLGMFLGSIMPWVDSETIGPQVFSYYAWPFLIFAIPNILFTCAILFALATTLRSMMASYIGTVVLVMGYLIVTGIIGNKIEYREPLARFDPIGLGAYGDITRYWTQAEMNSRLASFRAIAVHRSCGRDRRDVLAHALAVTGPARALEATLSVARAMPRGAAAEVTAR